MEGCYVGIARDHFTRDKQYWLCGLWRGHANNLCPGPGFQEMSGRDRREVSAFEGMWALIVDDAQQIDIVDTDFLRQPCRAPFWFLQAREVRINHENTYPSCGIGRVDRR